MVARGSVEMSSGSNVSTHTKFRLISPSPSWGGHVIQGAVHYGYRLCDESCNRSSRCLKGKQLKISKMWEYLIMTATSFTLLIGLHGTGTPSHARQHLPGTERQ